MSAAPGRRQQRCWPHTRRAVQGQVWDADAMSAAYAGPTDLLLPLPVGLPDGQGTAPCACVELTVLLLCGMQGRLSLG